MKAWITLAAAIAVAGSSTELRAQSDGLVAFPAVYKVQFENQWVRLVRVHVAGAANIGTHSHPPGFMFHVYLNDADPIVFNHDGPPYDITRPAVTARSYRIGTATPESHAVVNPSPGHTDFQRVEYKTQGYESSQRRVYASPLGITTSSVMEHKGELSRVTRVTIAAGASSEFVAPPNEPALLIIVTDATVADATGEGRAVTAGAERFVAPGSTSVFRNTGATPMQVLRFDFLTPPR